MRRILLFLLTFLLVSCGLFLLNTYGVGWDEEAQMKIGQMNADYMLGKNTDLLTHKDRVYGPAVEIALHLISRLGNSTKQIYLLRHAAIHLLFLISLLGFYKSIQQLFPSSRYSFGYGILGILLMVLSPRIYADTFYNSKDAVFLSLAVLHFYTLLRATRKMTYSSWMLHALVSALLVDVRLPGVFHVGLSTGLIIYLGVIKKSDRKKIGYIAGLYSALTLLFIYLCWPYLWMNPITRFVEAFQTMKAFPWEERILFKAQLIQPLVTYPKNYLLTWITITIPMVLFLFIPVGLIATLIQRMKVGQEDQRSVDKEILYALPMLYALVPLLILLVLKPVLYDGWRQAYFLYPFLVLLGLQGIHFLFNQGVRWLRIMVVSLLLGQFTLLGIFWIKHYPYGYVYFNETVSHKPNYLLQQYDRDYWGLSYKQALEKIVQLERNQEEDTVKVLVEHSPAFQNHAFVTGEKPVIKMYFLWNLPNYEVPKVKYYMTNHRWLEPFPALFDKPIWDAVVQGSRVVTITTRSERNTDPSR
jgi:hypothetical protein